MRARVAKSHRQVLGYPAAEATLARRRYLPPVVDVVLLEQPRRAIVCLAPDPDRAIERFGGALLEQHEMPELGLQWTARESQPEPQHAVWEEAVVAELDVARAERAQPALDLGKGGLVVRQKEREGIFRDAVHVAWRVVGRLPERERVPVDEDVLVRALELILVGELWATEIAGLDPGAGEMSRGHV